MESKCKWATEVCSVGDWYYDDIIEMLHLLMSCAGGVVQVELCRWRCAGGVVQVEVCRLSCAGRVTQVERACPGRIWVRKIPGEYFVLLQIVCYHILYLRTPNRWCRY